LDFGPVLCILKLGKEWAKIKFPAFGQQIDPNYGEKNPFTGMTHPTIPYLSLCKLNVNVLQSTRAVLLKIAKDIDGNCRRDQEGMARNSSIVK
jgi:hypothetical protein